MGHTRLGTLPKTRQWDELVSEIASSLGYSETSDAIRPISEMTLKAAQGGLQNAIHDRGLQYIFYLLTRLALSARSRDWPEELNSLGIHVPEDATLVDLTSEFQMAVDNVILSSGHSTDISEMAQRAAGEALTTLLRNYQGSLFGNDRDWLQQSVKERLSTKRGFGELGQIFFGNFLARFLNFYLSRLTAPLLGECDLYQLGDLTRFNDALHLHCIQSARIVRDFAGEWYSRTEWQQGINPQNTAGFVAVALKKLKAELAQQELGL